MPPTDPVLSRLASLLSDVTGADVATLGPASSAKNVTGWDSIANISLIGLIEEELGVTIATADALRLGSLGELAEFVRTRVPANGGRSL